MATRISAKTFDIAMSGSVIQAESATVTITDNTAVAKTNGVPDGHIAGSVEASGSIVFTSKYFKVFKEKAAAAGSYRGIDLIDLMFYADTGSEDMKVEVFGCKFLLTDLLNIDKKSDDAITHTLQFIVTSPDFIKIDGISVLSENDVKHLLNR